jgi:hypothetical protein
MPVVASNQLVVEVPPPTLTIIEVNPINLNFGNQQRGRPSSTQKVTISNTGTAPLKLTNVAITQNPSVFKLTRPAQCRRFPCTILPGNSLIFNVQARPNRLGPIVGNLRITSNDPDKATVNVPLQVNGTLTASSASGSILPQDKLFNITDLQIREVSNAIEFKVVGIGLTGLQVELYDLQGRKVAEAATEGGALLLRLPTHNSASLANGIYLYVITYRGPGGLAVRDQVERLVILR